MYDLYLIVSEPKTKVCTMSKAHPPELKKFMDKRIHLRINGSRQVYRSKYHTLIIAFILWKRYECNNYCLRVYLSLCRWREPCVGSTHSWTSCSAMPLSSRRQEVKILLVSNGNNARGWCSTQYYIAGMIVVRGNSVVMLEARDRIWKQYQDIVCAFSPNICSVVIFHFVFVIVIFLVKPVTRYFQLQNDQMHCKISLQGISSY